MEDKANKQANRLINEKSPYLLQHAYNPVDWYPWGEEAFSRAKKEERPVFLSIGYSTCHWCHVMEKESFEDREVAELLNKYFIPVKVDREERPDLDQIYMSACQAMTGQGGWPLTVFLTPDKKPFFAATYLPKYPRMGISGLIEFLPRVAEVWQKEREKVEQSAEEISEALRRQSGGGAAGAMKTAPSLPGEKTLDEAFLQFEKTYDHQYGGFGGAPKFPSPHQLLFLIRYWKRTGRKEALDMALETLKAIHRGGIFDQLGYGIHRYSVDQQWLVPHFEKMLYDQATTAYAALEAYRASNDPEPAALARKIFTYVLNDLTAPEGGFYSAEDADSEGEEGTFYVWRPEEVTALLGDERGTLINDYYGISAGGNFEKGKSILHRSHEDEVFTKERGLTLGKLAEVLEQSRQVLLEARNKRERPFRDDKVITAWNGMMIAALARGSVVLDEPEYLETASRAADFIENKLISSKGELLRRYRDHEASIPAFMEDYAYLARGLIELHLATGDKNYLEQARHYTRELDRLFNRGGELQFSSSSEAIPGLPVLAEAYDGAVPSGTSISALNYIQLGRLLSDPALIKKGENLIQANANMLIRIPTGHSALLMALDILLEAPEA